jgi:hypothetical protein
MIYCSLLHNCNTTNGAVILNLYSKFILINIFKSAFANFFSHKCRQPTHFLPNVTQKSDLLFPASNMCKVMHG